MMHFIALQPTVQLCIIFKTGKNAQNALHLLVASLTMRIVALLICLSVAHATSFSAFDKAFTKAFDEVSVTFRNNHIGAKNLSFRIRQCEASDRTLWVTRSICSSTSA